MDFNSLKCPGVSLQGLEQVGLNQLAGVWGCPKRLAGIDIKHGLKWGDTSTEGMRANWSKQQRNRLPSPKGRWWTKVKAENREPDHTQINCKLEGAGKMAWVPGFQHHGGLATHFRGLARRSVSPRGKGYSKHEPFLPPSPTKPTYPLESLERIQKCWPLQTRQQLGQDLSEMALNTLYG